MIDRIDRLGDAGTRGDRPELRFDPVSEITRILEAIPDRTKFLEELTATARRCFLADHAAILSLHRPTGRWFAEATQNLGPNDVEDIKGLSRTVIDQTRRREEPVLITDASRNDLTRTSHSIRMHNVQCVLTVPIYVSSDLWGLLYLDNTSVPDAFDDESMRQLSQFAAFAGIAILKCEELVSLSLGVSKSAGTSPRDEVFLDFRNPAMLAAVAVLKRAARTEAPILLLGENGTGKNVLAHWVHANSPRAKKPFVEINCAELSPNLIEVELFGVEAGVATGVDFREGKIKGADGGTVFLNEIGDLPLSQQAKVLRAIEERVVERIGGRTTHGVDVRFICATNRDLRAMANAGQFRLDLYFRINLLECVIPPLAQRPEDIPAIAEHLLGRSGRKHGKPGVFFSLDTVEHLQSLPWKGNIREMANIIEKAVILCEGDEIDLAGSRRPQRSGKGSRRPASLKNAVQQFEILQIHHALEQCGWTEARAARQLGLPESTLRSKIKRYAIRKPRRIL